MTLKSIALLLESRGHQIRYSVRSDGGIRIKEIDGKVYNLSEGNAAARKLAGKPASQASLSQRVKARVNIDKQLSKYLIKQKKQRDRILAAPPSKRKTQEQKDRIKEHKAAEKFQKHYDLDGISIPQPFCQSFMPFAIIFNKALDYIPGFSKLDIDAEGMKKKFGVLGEPLVLGVIVGMLIGWAAQLDIKKVLFLGVTMGAVMELIPRITSLFIEGLKPISEKTQELVKSKFNGKKVYIGMSPALVIGHPTTLVASVILIPVILALAVFLPGNQFLPLASLAGMFYLFPMVLPFTKGNVVKTLIIGLVTLIIGLYFVTDMAPDFTMAANQVYAATGDATAHIPEGFSGGALDFAASSFGWIIYKLSCHVKYVGPAILVAITLGMMWYNRTRIVKDVTRK